jgi:Cu-Zn family superoxide dismutase
MAYADKNGDAIIEQGDTQLDLYGDKSIIGRSLVIHKKKDDLGRGGDAGSLASGNSGPRIGCCTIGLVAGPKKSYGKGRNY